MVRGATWSEIDLEAALWTIPAARMKSGREHRVPLSKPAIQLLRCLPGDRPPEGHMFPGMRGPLSDMSLTAVLRRMEVSATAHGFRSTFRDWVSEFRPLQKLCVPRGMRRIKALHPPSSAS
jgi:integrase